MSNAKPVPDGFHTLTPYLVVRDAAKAIDFYQQAFGAEERYRMAMPDGSVAHAEIQVGDSVIMLSEENPQAGATSPAALGGSPVGLFLYLDDVDAAYQRAVDAGCEGVQPPADMFWGDRFSKLTDPFGHGWMIATHIEDVAPDEMGRRAEEAFSTMGG